MSAQLLEAIQLANAGRRDEARQMLRQVVRSEPNNEMAWLWLASVAADQDEYRRALNEVLRINPGNQQAKDSLAQLPPAPSSAAATTAAPRPQPPSSPPYGMPAAPSQPTYPRAQEPSPPYGMPQYGAQQPPPPYGVPPQQQPPYGGPAGYQYPYGPYAGQVPPRRRRGGCMRVFLFLFFLVILLPCLLCVGLSFTGRSLGPFDLVAVYFPGDMGRKTISFQLESMADDGAIRTVSIDVPRTWYVAEEGDTMWSAWESSLNDSLKFNTASDSYFEWGPFDSDNASWNAATKDLSTLTLEEGGVYIVDTNPLTAGTGGAPVVLIFDGIQILEEGGDLASYRCDDLREAIQQSVEQSGETGIEFQVIEMDGGLCAAWAKNEEDYTGDRIFADFDAPSRRAGLQLVVPVDNERALFWSLIMPANQYDTFKDDIDAMIQSAALD